MLRKSLLLILLLGFLILPVGAISAEMPAAPESAELYLPSGEVSFADGLIEIGKNVLHTLAPSFREAAASCLGVLAAVILCGLFKTSLTEEKLNASELLGVAAIGWILLQSTGIFIRLGLETANEISNYGQLLLPIMSGALVASGGATKASALYLGTAFTDSLLIRLVSNGIGPLCYLFVAAAIAAAVVGNSILSKMRDLLKNWITWGLKLVLYIFTGYMTITGVVSGSTDATALRAAKLTISGAVPVVGSILSDASEAVLVGAGVVRSTVGVGGLLVIIAITAAPFLRAGIQYLLLKMTAAWCGVVGNARHAALVDDFGQVMGLVLAMIGTCCLLQLISIVCFMKGVS